MLSLEELRNEVETGGVDTVVAAFTDMQGRLMGKRQDAEHFLAESVDHGLEGCNYLLALDMEMEPQRGYEMASWERGYGDFHLTPDLSTLRRIPWLDGTALVLCDVDWEDGSPVVASPRQVLRRQVERARASGFEPMLASELEFYLLKESYAEAHTKSYRDLTPSVPYVLDYNVLATTYDEPLIREIRRGMRGAGLAVESSKGEAWPGQHEVNFRFADALTTADNHVVYKNGAKEIAHRHGRSITFMAKPDHTWIGNSCHIHASLWRDGANAFGDEGLLFSRLPRRVDRVRAGARAVPRAERQLVQALRRRLVGADDARVGKRQPHVRVSRRRSRGLASGGDADSRWRCQSVSGVRGAHRGRAARDVRGARRRRAARGQRVRVGRGAVSVDAARGGRRARGGTTAREAFGDHVVEHYLNYARVEQRLFDSVVTNWERERLFERG